MVNAMVLAEAFGLGFRFSWRDGDESLSRDPGELFAKEFVSQYAITESELAAQTSHVLDDGEFDLRELLTGSESPTFVEVDWPIGLHPAVVALGDGVRRHFADVFRSIPLSRELRPVIDRLDGWEAGVWTGVHIRAGDIVAGSWRRTMWHEKYVPSPLLRRSIDAALAEGRHVIVISDNQEYASWLVDQCPGCHTTADALGDMTQLTNGQRALADLLVLSRCATIVAPPLSAFSTLASSLGDCHLTTPIERLSRETAHAAMMRGLREQLDSNAPATLGPHTARDHVWFVDAFCDIEPPRALLDRARVATELDASFTSAWARRARLAARVGRFHEAWAAVDIAVATAQEDQRQDDSAVDADLAAVVVGCLELIDRGWRFSARSRSRRLSRVIQALTLCGARRPHHWQKPALQRADVLVGETRIRLRQTRREQLRYVAETRRRLLEPFASQHGDTIYGRLRNGKFDAFALDLDGLVHSLAGSNGCPTSSST